MRPKLDPTGAKPKRRSLRLPQSRLAALGVRAKANRVQHSERATVGALIREAVSDFMRENPEGYPLSDPVGRLQWFVSQETGAAITRYAAACGVDDTTLIRYAVDVFLARPDGGSLHG